MNSYLGTNQLSHVISDVKKDVLFAHINLVSTIADTFRRASLIKQELQRSQEKIKEEQQKMNEVSGMELEE